MNLLGIKNEQVSSCALNCAPRITTPLLETQLNKGRLFLPAWNPPQYSIMEIWTDVLDTSLDEGVSSPHVEGRYFQLPTRQISHYRSFIPTFRSRTPLIRKYIHVSDLLHITVRGSTPGRCWLTSRLANMHFMLDNPIKIEQHLLARSYEIYIHPESQSPK